MRCRNFSGKICTRGELDKLDRSRGRLRSWLLASFSNHLSTLRTRASCLKRGGGLKHVPVDRKGLETFYQSDMSAMSDADMAYSRAWALTLMDEALARLEDHYKAGGRDELFETLLPALESPLPDSTYEETAARLVALAQIFCFLLPLLQLITIYTSTCLVWLKPDDPPWIHGLSLTTTRANGILNPWEFQVFPMLLDGTLSAMPEATRIVGPLPGGRTRIAVPLRDKGKTAAAT